MNTKVERIVTKAFEQNAMTKGMITFSFVGLETITGVILAVLLAFLSVEKDITKKQEEIKARKENSDAQE